MGATQSVNKKLALPIQLARLGLPTAAIWNRMVVLDCQEQVSVDNISLHQYATYCVGQGGTGISQCKCSYGEERFPAETVVLILLLLILRKPGCVVNILKVTAERHLLVS